MLFRSPGATEGNDLGPFFDVDKPLHDLETASAEKGERGGTYIKPKGATGVALSETAETRNGLVSGARP